MKIPIVILSIILLVSSSFAEDSPITQTIKTGIGVKSVVISPDGAKVYSINLEEMSVSEIDRVTKLQTRKLRFVGTRGNGFNYKTKTAISSFEEKPVEGHITHNGRYLWLSLHNAGGVVVWDFLNNNTSVPGQPSKKAFIETSSLQKIPTNLLFLKTGKTPKVITSSPDGNYLFVANWHSK